MTAFVNSIEIDRPADEVFAYVVDPAKFPEWQRDVTRVSVQGDEVGSHFTTVRKIGGTERSMTQEITESVPPRTWAARGVDGPIRPNATVDIEPIAADRCRVTFGLDFDGRGMASALVPMVRRMAAKVAPASHQRLKELLEGDQ
ncbi:SRPBCC family protein [Actinomadura bangladeshensis]|uniref:SRPBCC family protein n=1 Tax=Actinomadura bangladeshensis TaxID=453573 RepID=A0A6L9QMS9_9ACTN|nr:SRPBCC family protein [Actinomadura bangladeshensis]NEA26839.1 SRPBCC family protein [Actinomadura bangladeshensis]